MALPGRETSGVKTPRTLWIVLTVVAAGILAFAVDLLRFGGQFTRIEPAFAGSCDPVALDASVEDIKIDRTRGIAYLSYLDRAALIRGDNATGTIMLMDLNIAEPRARAAMAYDPAGFRPHGIFLLQRPDTPARLFAVSHPPDGTHAVVIAEQGSSGQFFPEEPVRDPLFVHPNAVAAVGPRQFYVANDSGAASGFERASEVLLRRGLGTVVYYDGDSARVVERGVKFAAGIALSPDTSRLYLAETLAKQLRIYRRDPVTGDIELDETVPLGTAPDNLNVDQDGVVWIAAHPKLLAFRAHVKEPAKRAPAQVLRFDPRGPKPAEGENDTRVTQVYLDAGEKLSAATVAAAWRDQFLLGGLLDHKVFICKPTP